MTITIHEDGIDRPATKAEIAIITERLQLEEARLAEEATAAALKAEAKAGLLARLNITEAEAELLLG